MMKNKNKEFSFLSCKTSIIFYINALEALFILILTIISFYGIARPILYTTNYSNNISLKEESAKKLTSILTESNLAIYNE